MPLIITIDGPAAAGKGTLARALGDALGVSHLDTGLLFRAAASRSLKGEDPVAAAQSITGEDLQKDDLRSAQIGQEASRISTNLDVRAALDKLMLDFARRPEGGILDGRDVGISICPEAPLKFFVTASPEARALRRHQELASKGFGDTLEEVQEDMRIRDERDSSRAACPLRPAEDAITLDTSELTGPEVLEIALEHVDRVLSLRKAA